MNKYDLHIHSYYSPCSSNSPDIILKTAKKVGLSGIAITDHNTIKAGDIINKLNKDKNFEVIIGEEITTDKGDMIALYINEEIKPGNILNVIDEIKSQGAMSVIAHPSRLTPWQRLRFPIQELVGKADAVEVFNSRNIGWANKTSMEMIKELDFAAIGSSDAHIPIDIGKGYTLFEGDLRKAIRKRQTRAEGTTRYALLSGIISVVNSRILTPLKVKKQWT